MTIQEFRDYMASGKPVVGDKKDRGDRQINRDLSNRIWGCVKWMR